MMNKHIGSDFDEYLQEQGLLAEANATATKRVLAYQIEQAMRRRKLSKTAMAHRMRTSRASLNRLLDPENNSVTLQTLERAAEAVGLRLRVELV
ncbi:MAG: Fis family transcriptional regulator [Chloroflexi bacterium]|nr:MAG: Fis family transcriptional regulator [Chloroflexota bacterium]